jgi:hypothetical protein
MESTMIEQGTDSEPTYGPYDAENPPPLAFHDWAERSAKLAGLEADARLDTLDGWQMPEALWDACNRFWLTTLAMQIATGNYRMAELYAGLCVEERKRRATPAPATPPPAGNVDATGFLLSLPKDPALPFAASAATPPVASPATPAADAGATQTLEARRAPDEALPFTRPKTKT